MRERNVAAVRAGVGLAQHDDAEFVLAVREQVVVPDGKISGVASSTGVFPVNLQLAASVRQEISEKVKPVVRGPNLARSAQGILSSVRKTDTARRDPMWLAVPRSLHADQIEVSRDGKRLGNESTFYSVQGHGNPKQDFFGFEWSQPQCIGLLACHTGAVEENGGWFTSLDVEYRAGDGTWNAVDGLLISPPLPPGPLAFNKPHFVEYLLSFRPVTTKAVRIIGNAGGTDHRRSSTGRTSLRSAS